MIFNGWWFALCGRRGTTVSPIGRRAFVAGGLVVLVALLVGGCARLPSDGTIPDIPPRTLLSEITVAGEINPQYYYFLALGTDQTRATGPIPIVTGPEYGNGWGVIGPLGQNDPLRQPPFFVQVHNSIFEQFRVDPVTNIATPLGPPYRGEISQDRTRITIEIDQRLIATPIPAVVQLNWITNTEITTSPGQIGYAKEYDAFGRTGNGYLDGIPLDVVQAWTDGQAGIPKEEPNDSTDVADIDLIGWRVEVKIRGPVE